MDASALPVSEKTVAELVDRFYERIRADARLGPMFIEAIPDWDGHLKIMRDFWSAVLLRTSRYGGCVMSPHFSLPIEAGDFDRWLKLFRPSVAETLPPEAAERALAVAEGVTARLRHMFEMKQARARV